MKLTSFRIQRRVMTMEWYAARWLKVGSDLVHLGLFRRHGVVCCAPRDMSG